MIGTKLYQKKSRSGFFLMMYGILALIGVALIAVSLSRNQDPSGAEGFTLIFGVGMFFLTWYKRGKPRVIVRDEYLELKQQFSPQFVTYSKISTVTRTKDDQLIIAVREGHDIKKTTIWLKDLEAADGDRLEQFLRKKGWKA